MKMVPGRAGARKWKDEEKAEIILKHDFGEEAFSRKLISPTAVEENIGKRKFKERFGRAVVQSESKPILVPDTDKRQALPSAQDDFTDDMV
jgi:hypothetical protein